MGPTLAQHEGRDMGREGCFPCCCSRGVVDLFYFCSYNQSHPAPHSALKLPHSPMRCLIPLRCPTRSTPYSGECHPGARLSLSPRKEGWGAGVLDAGVLDAGALDAGALDAGALDAGAFAAGALAAGAFAAGALDHEAGQIVDFAVRPSSSAGSSAGDDGNVAYLGSDPIPPPIPSLDRQ